MSLTLPALRRIVLIGAHCDDIAIGAGATLLRLAEANPGMTAHVLVMSGRGTPREAEEQAALSALLPRCEVTLDVLGLPDGRLPQARRRVKDALQSMAAAVPHADLVISPHRHDAHQDHRLVGELVPTAFRSHLHLGYEILKWEGDLPTTTVYQPIDAATAEAKIEILHRSYRSQAGKDWFDDEAFRGLMRVRGVQCHRQYAEAFVCDKAVLAD